MDLYANETSSYSCIISEALMSGITVLMPTIFAWPTWIVK